MKQFARAMLACLVLAATDTTPAATVAADTATLAVTQQAAARLPQARTLTVSASGRMRVTLTDKAAPSAFSQLRLLVSRGGSRILVQEGAGAQEFDAEAGDYKLQVLGVAGAPAGTFEVEVRSIPGNALLLQFAHGIEAAPPASPAGQSALQTSIAIAQTGNYTVTLRDRAFPAALSAIDMLLLRADGTGLPITLQGPCAAAACTTTFTATAPGPYNLIVVATASNPDQAGLYTLQIDGGPQSGIVYASTQPVGLLRAALPVSLPAADAYTLSLQDLATPAPLAALRARLMQGATQLAVLDAQGTVPTTGAQAGQAQLFVFGKTAAGAAAGAGVYIARVTRGATQNVVRSVQTLPAGFDAASNTGGYLYTFDVPSAGDYRLRLRDLDFPDPFSRLAAVLVQNDQARLEVRSSDSESVVALALGPAYLAVLGSPQSAGANSLLGLSLGPAAGGAMLLDQAQGIGSLIATHQVEVPAAGAYDLKINDLQFPAAFADLAVAVTRGTQRVGNIFGGGPPITFDAQPGVHFLNLLARPATDAQFATWGFELSHTPPLPTVTLGATPASVVRGASAALNWSSTGATTCSATGGWNGARTTAGSEPSPVIDTATTFTLSCTGPGGTTSSSVTVSLSAAGTDGDGGGGSVGIAAILWLAGLLAARRRGFTAR